MQDPKAFQTFAEVYPFYLTEHSNKTCRRLHFVGSSLALVCVAMLLGAWVGHFGFEKNKPASFKRPAYSFLGDWVMYKDIWLGKVKIW